MQINPIRERRHLTACTDGGIKPPSASSGNDQRLKSVDFSNGVKSKVWFEKNGKLVFGIGKAMILKSIQKAGSINKAARELNMSYRHAWSYIKSAEKRLGKPLVICTKGGVNGGSTTLTPYAKNLLKKFFNLESRVKLFADKVYKETF